MVLITNNGFPHSNIEDVRAYGIKAWTLNIDTPANVHARLDTNLPPIESVALALVKERIASITPEEMMSFFRPQALIIKWDIRKLPAMVIGDGDYVIYGVTDYLVALDLYESYMP